MGKTSRRKSTSGQRRAEALRKEEALFPFHLIFGLSWVLFGGVALVYGFRYQDQRALVAGGLVGVLGGFLLVRAIRGWRRFRAQNATGESPGAKP